MPAAGDVSIAGRVAVAGLAHAVRRRARQERGVNGVERDVDAVVLAAARAGGRGERAHVVEVAGGDDRRGAALDETAQLEDLARAREEREESLGILWRCLRHLPSL